MTALRATIRLQFNSAFTLDDAVPLVPYFAALGISHIYASPLLAATPGSSHGYDTIDCQRLDPERGGEDGLSHLVEALHAHDMGLILDIVPNHMGVGPHNRWWEDVLAHGTSSRYARFFDIDWHSEDPTLHGKVLLPFLGAPLDDVLNEGAISLHFSQRLGSFMLHYGEHRFPVSPDDTRRILDTSGAEAPSHGLLEWLESGSGADALAKVGNSFAPRAPIGRAHLAALLARQHYRLAWWRVANDRVNWRRFFDITTLAALRMDDEIVFEAAHALVFDLYREGMIDGVRADHIDGLAKPAEYCRRLQERLAAFDLARATPEAPAQEMPRPLDDAPIIYVEKILADNEVLPASWPVSGTTGYDFLEQVALVLHDPAGELPLTAFWERFGPSHYDTMQRRARAEKLTSSFYGDMNALVAKISAAATHHAPGRDMTAHAIHEVMEAICVAFPVYRSYFADHLTDIDTFAGRAALSFAATDARRHLPPFRRDLIAWLQALLRGEITTIEPKHAQEIVERFEHLTAPLTAKAGEDTAFYRYGRLLSRNDVGTDPGRFASSVGQFHETNTHRLYTHPFAMLATATHDHKRGEDGRARLMVLSEPEADWLKTAEDWFARNARYRKRVAYGLAPSRADELFIYQTLISVWPNREAEKVDLRARLGTYLQKSMREAGLHTSWSEPDEPYEVACMAFLDALLNDDFRDLLTQYIARIAPAAALNGLSQTLLRVTSPGVPDLYQGTEFWDHSLVDPDNRRPVDFQRRVAALRLESDFVALAADWRSGAVKQRLIRDVLSYRRDHAALFAEGSYAPVDVSGPLADHLIAFRRDHEGASMLVLAPRRPFALKPDDRLRVHDTLWRNTVAHVKSGWRSLLYGHPVAPSDGLGYLDGLPPIDVLVSD